MDTATKAAFAGINAKLDTLLKPKTSPFGVPGTTGGQIVPVIVTEPPKSTGGNWNLYPDPKRVYSADPPPAGKMWLYNSESGERIAVTPCATLGG